MIKDSKSSNNGEYLTTNEIVKMQWLMSKARVNAGKLKKQNTSASSQSGKNASYFLEELVSNNPKKLKSGCDSTREE
ncbi:hypothetical protein [Escherichia coli]|uniref:hypothetical protein n=1 Tax=Escherichia coli TaxID=562 RepID=UPI000DDC16DA|nr:hypothetical protein [Escherichia coli]EFH8442899.1 hypothetical protein [Escherichia coli]EHX8487823.1 hypothetical protein [Escherichia coli]EMF2410863.1 hypothetical protein [Escherichia coli]MCN2838171.1 hypothetical protein [Escherichia coli]MCN4692994.1 hypothetical protein [Escherichia coli]